MPIVLKVPVSDDIPDAVVEVEADRQDLGEGVELMAGRTNAATAPYTLAAGIQQVVPALKVMLAGLRSVTPGVDEVQIQLGLRVGGESGLVFVKAGAEATFTVTLRWRTDGSGAGHGNAS